MTFLELQTKTRLLLGGISTTEYSEVNIEIALNNYYHDFIITAILSNKDWEVSGEVATANIVANQREYLLPTDLLTLKKIEVNLQTSAAENQWTAPRIIDLRSIPSVALTNYQDSDDTIDSAFEVRIYDESIFFNRLPKNSVTNGLKVYYSKEATDLSADGDTPNLPNTLHIGLAYGAALDYSIETEQNRRISNFKALLEEKMDEVIAYYKQRLVKDRARLGARQEIYE